MESLGLNLNPEGFILCGFAAGWLAGVFGAFVRWMGRGNVDSSEAGI